MKNKIWLFQIPIVAFFALCFQISELGVQGDLNKLVLREKIFPVLKTVTGWFTNLKFLARGPIEPKNKVVIVEIDGDAIAQLGRWPWHRDVTSFLVQKTFDAGAKVVGLDIVFSEPDTRVSEEMAKLLTDKGMAQVIPQFETDLVMQQIIKQYKSRLVLGWATDRWCQPSYSSPELCPVAVYE